jgi:hypothetical protein
VRRSRRSSVAVQNSWKLADLILVNGDPTTNISDIRKLDTVIKRGAVMYPAEIWQALGVRPQ